MPPRQFADNFRHDQTGHEADGEGPLARGHVADPALRRVRRREQGARVVEQGLAGERQARCPVVTFEQPYLQVAFQRANLAREHRLRDVQGFRRAAEVQLVGDRDEIPQLAQVQVHGASSDDPLRLRPDKPHHRDRVLAICGT
jgi:hypothetical protein